MDHAVRLKSKTRNDREIGRLRQQAAAALAAVNVLFEYPSGREMVMADIEHRDFVLLLRDAFQAAVDDLQAAEFSGGTMRFYQVESGGMPDSIDRINRLAETCAGRSPATGIDAAVMDLAAMQEDFFAVLEQPDHPAYPQTMHLLRHAGKLSEVAAGFFPAYLTLLKKLAGPADGRLPRVGPAVATLCGDSEFLPRGGGEMNAAQLQRLRLLAENADPFRRGRTFRYYDGNFVPVQLSSIRPVAQFYGYNAVKDRFQRYFSSFVAGECNIPLLITSLPGMGKTHFTIGYSMSFPELTLILPEPEELGKGLPGLIRRLALRRNHKFVVFFDDIDPHQIDWYYFRTNIGGSLVPPPNVILVLASNYNFPPNVCSRGREVEFPPFDLITCSGMIYDYLVALKMRSPKDDLVNTIAADYLEEFGQHVYSELSPRSLVHYLGNYDRDELRRRRMLDISRSDVVPRPDAQMFQDFNVKLIRRFYGESGIEELRERMLERFSSLE